MHYHVMACSAAGTVFREHRFDDAEESVKVYLALTREFYQDKIIADPTGIEQQMYDMVANNVHDTVTIGNPPFIMAWVPCAGCINRKIYN